MRLNELDETGQDNLLIITWIDLVRLLAHCLNIFIYIYMSTGNTWVLSKVKMAKGTTSGRLHSRTTSETSGNSGGCEVLGISIYLSPIYLSCPSLLHFHFCSHLRIYLQLHTNSQIPFPQLEIVSIVSYLKLIMHWFWDSQLNNLSWLTWDSPNSLRSSIYFSIAQGARKYIVFA